MKKLVLFLVGILLISCDPQTTSDDNKLPVTYQELKDVPYGEDGAQVLDLYLPADRSSAETKVIIAIHGGGWSTGSKAELNSAVNLLKGQWPEVAIVNINYRLATADKNHHSTQINDIENVIQFLKKNKEEYQISENLALIGHSAGAHLALLYAYHFNTSKSVKCVADIAGPTQIKDYEWNKTMASVFTQFMGFPLNSENQQKYLEASPWYWIDENTVPTIVFHGTLDFVVPIYQSNWLVGKLNENKVTTQYKIYDLEGHELNSTNLKDCVSKIVPFFKENMK